MSPSGYLVGLVVVIGLGTLHAIVRSLQEVADGRFEWEDAYAEQARLPQPGLFHFPGGCR